MSSAHPVIEAANLGECWLAVSALILSSGDDALYDAQPVREVARLTLSARSTDPHDAIIDRHGDPAWLEWMHANFFDFAAVPELGDAASYATRLFDYGHTGRDQIQWVTDRLAADPNCKSASITTFMPLTDTAYIPCVSLLDFWIRDGAVDLVVYAHSLDFGKKAYGNLVELALLQARVADSLQRPRGMLTIHVKSAHIYEPEYVLMSELVAAGSGSALVPGAAR
jgi:thymidylate synthase